tara:strand:- start:201 stop:308 length:108 start_codon:yes stop_codon:yes gene_type:complete
VFGRFKQQMISHEAHANFLHVDTKDAPQALSASAI